MPATKLQCVFLMGPENQTCAVCFWLHKHALSFQLSNVSCYRHDAILGFLETFFSILLSAFRGNSLGQPNLGMLPVILKLLYIYTVPYSRGIYFKLFWNLSKSLIRLINLDIFLFNGLSQLFWTQHGICSYLNSPKHTKLNVWGLEKANFQKASVKYLRRFKVRFPDFFYNSSITCNKGMLYHSEFKET